MNLPENPPAQRFHSGPVARRLTLGMIAVLLIAFGTFVAADVISRNVFERLPHLEDEFAYLYQAKIFARGQAWVVRNEPVKVFWEPFIIQPETSTDGVLKRFGKYTPGWPMILAIGAAMNMPWVVNAFLAMITVALVYRMGREIFSEPVGLVAALLLAASPMALLLNATLMSHTSAMFMAVWFVYAYWRLIKHGKGRFLWAIVAGLSLGWIISTRPLTAVAIAAPIMLHSLSRLLDALFDKPVAGQSKSVIQRFGATLMPLVVLSVFVAPTGLLWPIFNQIWTGNWRTNVYTLLWDYDQVGFGPGHGIPSLGGHTLELGWRNARADLTIYMRDLFGFTLQPGLAQYAENNWGWGLGVGISFIPVLAGLIAGRKNEWVWLFFELFVAIVIAQLAYWIGSTVYGAAAYSLRYYYEATFGVCLVAAYGIVAWAETLRKPRPAASTIVSPDLCINQDLIAAAIPIDSLNGPLDGRAEPVVLPRKPLFKERLGLAWATLWPGYFILLVAVGVSLAGYTPARFREKLPPDWPDGLWHYNEVGQYQLDAINTMRRELGNPNQPVLIIILHDPNPLIEDNWRDYGAAMAVSSPFLDSDIIVARVFERDDVPQFAQRFSGRLVLYQVGTTLYPSLDKVPKDITKQSQVQQ